MLMLAVMAIALGLAVLQEVRVWGPARRAREKYIKIHAGLAKIYDRELAGPPPFWPMPEDVRLAGPPPYWPMTEELRQALIQLSAWHARRAAELRRAGRFDPEAERALDRKSSPSPDDEWVREQLDDYRNPTFY